MTIRRAILAGFGLVIALWTASAYDLVSRLNDLEARATRMNERFIRSERLLTRVRFQVLLSSLAFRDAILDTKALDEHRTQIAAAKRSVDQAMREYTEVMREYRPLAELSDEPTIFADLASELDSFWKGMLPVLEWDPSRRAAEAISVVRQSISPKRELVLSISDTVRALNRDAYSRQQDRISELYRQAQMRVLGTSGTLLFLSIGVAVTVLVYTGRLEQQLRTEMQRDAENRRALQRLSERLVRAQEDERSAIARELHDEIGQALTAVKMELSVAERASTQPGQTGQYRLDEARAITDRALNAVRDLSKLLHPQLLDDLGLIAALDWHLRAFSRRTGIRVEMEHEGPDRRFSPLVETHAYRIVQEALTNVARHAKASSCSVRVETLGDTVRIAVEDDGIGFDVAASDAAASRKGVGLLGIRERVQTLGGSLNVQSSPESGTRLSVELPATAREEPALPQTRPLDMLADGLQRT